MRKFIDNKKFSSLCNRVVITFSPYLYSCRRIWCWNLEGIPPKKIQSSHLNWTLIWRCEIKWAAHVCSLVSGGVWYSKSHYGSCYSNRSIVNPYPGVEMLAWQSENCIDSTKSLVLTTWKHSIFFRIAKQIGRREWHSRLTKCTRVSFCLLEHRMKSPLICLLPCDSVCNVFSGRQWNTSRGWHTEICPWLIHLCKWF